MEVGRRAMARETVLLGGWFDIGLPSWGKVETHLDRVSPFWGTEHLNGGASQATATTRSLGYHADARSVEHRRCLGCFLH